LFLINVLPLSNEHKKTLTLFAIIMRIVNESRSLGIKKAAL